MKFKTHAAMQSHPDFHLNARLDPLGFELSARGSCEAGIGSVSARVDRIPIRLAIPFLKNGRQPPLLATIGPFSVVLSPIQVRTEAVSMRLEGVLGSKGIAAEVDGKVGCETRMDMEGQLSGKVGTFQVALEEDQDQQ
jgi:hypothetical protein